MFVKLTKISSSTEPRKRKARTKTAEKVQELPIRKSKRIAERKLKKLNAKRKLEDPFEELFEKPIEEPDEKNYDRLVADLPKCRAVMKEDNRKEEDSETKLWSPLSETDEKWFPFYIFMARSALMFTQQQQRRISISRAMKNACFDYTEQYIRDVLHESNYKTDVALKTLVT
ncbi:hypothetical protein E2986_11689 [Frieseomelitta varia]|uniref:ELM2 domain-containing protein n=1 Tax=Frieseomelitta varia TaxID=561572 RepID=A0A833VV92_9HYME|nr:hypothetical protein E2986_11689 [Frieseomelitta varia]